MAITGLDADEYLNGIDFRPVNGVLYAVTTDLTGNPLFNRLVTVNTTTGAVTPVSATTLPLPDTGLYYGLDFNPVTDRFRQVSINRGNRRLDPDTGAIAGTDTALAYAAGDPNFGVNPNVAHVAHFNNSAGALSTTLFGIDTNTDSLVRIGGVNGAPSPNGGQLTTIGPLGVNVAGFGGFDIDGTTGVAYASLSVSGVSNLHTVNLATGAATLVGAIAGAGNVDGLAVAPPSVVCTGAFNNVSALTIPDGPGAATPYPSDIFVAGLPGNVTKVTVKLLGLSHTSPDDLDVLLTAPNGVVSALIMSDAGGVTGISNINLQFDDASDSTLPDSAALATGTYRPTNFGAGDVFPSPAPVPSGGSALSAFIGSSPFGFWRLYVYDDTGGGSGTLANGWEVTLTTDGCSPSPPVLTTMASRRTHGGAGAFDLPLSNNQSAPTTEPRQGPVHSIVFTYNKPIASAGVQVLSGVATAGTPTYSGNDVTVPLTGVADQQYVTVSLSNVLAADGGIGAPIGARIGFLAGDVSQNRVVSVSDVGQVNAVLAQPVSAANFLKDVNASGSLTVGDKALANGNLTRSLPPP